MNKATLNDNRRKRGHCIIKGCINHYGKWTTKSVSYYAVPSTDTFKHWKTDRRLTWMRAIIRHNKFSSDWQTTKNSKLCNLHFVGGKKSEHPLHPSYNPTLFPSQKIVEEDRVQNIKQQIVEDWSENEEPLSARTSTVVHEPKRQRRKKPRVKGTRPTIVLVRKNFVEEPVKDGASTNDFECQVEFDVCGSGCESPINCLICNLKVENGMNYAETQVDMKKHENSWNNKKVNSIEFAWEQKINFAGISSVRFNDNLIDLCGVNFKQFNIILSAVPDNPENSSVSNANRLFITLIKLRQGLSYVALSIYFTMQQSLVHETFGQTLPFLKEFAENRIAWIKKEVIQNYLPEVFKPEYLNCRAMIDCIEIQVELPQSAEAQKDYYKNYKYCNAFKVFIACAPNGFIMYRSKCYGGQKADGLIAQDCGFLDLIKSDDVILTDQEFPSLDVALINKGAILKKIDVAVDSELFPLYINMKKSLNQLKHFKILSAMPMDQLENIDSIIQICCSLVNLDCLMSIPKTENNI